MSGPQGAPPSAPPAPAGRSSPTRNPPLNAKVDVSISRMHPTRRAVPSHATDRQQRGGAGEQRTPGPRRAAARRARWRWPPRRARPGRRSVGAVIGAHRCRRSGPGTPSGSPRPVEAEAGQPRRGTWRRRAAGPLGVEAPTGAGADDEKRPPQNTCDGTPAARGSPVAPGGSIRRDEAAAARCRP